MKITLLTGQTFDLENSFPFPLEVKKSIKLKRLSVRIDGKKKQVVLNMPRFCSSKKAFAFISEHQEWIEAHLNALPQVKDFEDGEKIMLFGQEVLICHKSESLSAPKLENGVLYVGGDKRFLHRRVKDYIKKRAQEEFSQKSEVLAAKLGCKLIGVSIKDTKSRWGSCSSLNHINYNWRIALAPACVIDYLMAHEVSHLKHRNHSPAFWQCVKELYAGAAIGRSWLKAHGNELYLYR